jgi:threonine aldolase
MILYTGMSDAETSVACLCDLRSDTMTRPDTKMRVAMSNAAVGDDVYGEDPTVAELVSRLAEMLGKDAAAFFPTGTQSNLAAVMAHCGRGDEIIVGRNYHIYCDEAAGVSVLAGVAMHPIDVGAGGEISPAAVQAAVKEDDPHYARSTLLCLENTVGGRVIPLDSMRATAQAARDKGLKVHLDGARFFNAITDLGCTAKELADCADSVSVCLSKGLGTPVGSVLAGDADLIKAARRNRKILGGAMRQSGVLAAAGLYALKHNISELAGDHTRAQKLADALLQLNAGDVQLGTNMLFFTPRDGNPAGLREHMAQAGVRIGGQSPTLRMVLHRDVTDEALNVAIAAFETYFG